MFYAVPQSDRLLPGDVILLKTPTQSIVVLDSVKAAIDLLEKRSAIYSSRPQIRMHELYVEDHTIPLNSNAVYWLHG